MLAIGAYELLSGAGVVGMIDWGREIFPKIFKELFGIIPESSTVGQRVMTTY
jgi:hypothetical protein